MTAVLVAFILGVILTTLVQRPRHARRARRVAGWEAFKATVADCLLLLDLKGVYSHREVGSSNPTPTGDTPQLRLQ